MTAFCGWLNLGKRDLSPTETLHAMAAAYRGHRQNEMSINGPAAAIWASADDIGGRVCKAAEPWAAIIGAPHWRETSLIREQKTQGNAAALRRAYRDYGLNLFAKLAGTFAFAIVDATAGRIMLAIDRMGINRLCYATTESELVFGSTADLVRAHPGVGATIPLQSIYNYLHAYVCRSPHTIYAEQRKLGPAQYLIWERGRVQVVSYWRMPFNPDRGRSAQDLGEELVARVRSAARRALPNGKSETIGAFLSGGLDSSTVAGMLSEVSKGPAQTFTIGFDEASYDEMRYAEATVSKFGAKHHRHYLTAAEVADMAPKVASYYDEPFGNSSAIPTFFCAARARQENVTCLLAGDGGDEILAGNSRYLEHEVYGRRYRALPPALRRVLELVAARTPLLRDTPTWHKGQRYIARAGMTLPDRLEAFNFYQISRMTEVFEDDALKELDLEAPWRETRAVFEDAESSDPLQRMMHLDLKQALADADLKKVTGMCELAGVDVAFPFLDDELVAFCATIPPEFHLKDGRLRAFFKDAFKDFLPADVIAKKKHGFGMPFYEWTRDHPGLRTLAYDSLIALRRRHLVRSAFIDKVMAQHARPQPTDYDGLAWDLMMLELWLEAHETGQVSVG